MILRNTFINAQLILNHLGENSLNLISQDQEEAALKNRKINWNSQISYKSPRKENGPMTPPKPSQHRKAFKGKSILKKDENVLDISAKELDIDQRLKEIKNDKKGESN